MRKIKLTSVVERDTVAFWFGSDRRYVVSHEPTEVEDQVATLIEAQYPGWTERVASKSGQAVSTLKATTE